MLRWVLRRGWLGILLAVLWGTTVASAGQAKYVILMISDGQGFNGWQASSYYLYDQPAESTWRAALPYGGESFSFYGCTHYPLGGGYDAQAFWSEFAYAQKHVTDSAAASTALHTGQKTENGRIATDQNNLPMTSIAELAAGRGLATGVVTSVPFTHATPAAADAHASSRKQTEDLARDMLYRSDLDVVMGCGLGTKYCPEEIAADLADDGQANGFAFVHDPKEFAALAEGTFGDGTLPQKVAGLCDKKTLSENSAEAVPTLAVMTRGALRVLGQDADGFYLMVEGGAVDWANHKQDLPGMLREQADFDSAVQAVLAWIEDDANGSSWDNTLLVITADHETGMLWGPGSWTDTNDNKQFDADKDEFLGYQPVADNGKGTLPGVQYGSKHHTQQLVPLWIRGRGAELMEHLVDGTDEHAGAFWFFDGRYVDNTDVFTVMKAAIVK